MSHNQLLILGRIFVLLLSTQLLSNTALAQYQINDNASQTSCNCYELTGANQWENGSVWNVNLFDLSNPFDFTFDVFLGCNDGGADGMAFVLQPLSVNAGSAGAGIGYEGVTPSLAVEMDTYENASDPAFDHIAIQTNGVVDHNGGNTLAGPVQASSTSGNIEDCAWHILEVIWNPATQTFEVYFDGVLRVSYTGDIINNLFNGDPNVYWGFTASTGGESNQHQFCNALAPSFSLAPTQACVDEQVDFQSTSVVATNIITSYDWDFGDGNSGTGDTPSHTYTTAGTYTVTLTIESEGCTESTTEQITINPSPDATLGPDITICEGLNEQLAPQNIDPTLTYSWSPATGLSDAAIADPFASPTTTTVYTLTVSDPGGCSSTDDIEVTVNPLPNPIMNIADGVQFCEFDEIQFENLTVGNVASVLWDFGDNAFIPAFPNTQSTLDNPTFFYDNFAFSPYTVTLVITDDNGCLNVAQNTVVINDKPEPAFSATNVCEQTATDFTDGSTAFTSTVNSWSWDFGDGLGTSTEQNPSYTYSSDGTFTTELIIGTDAGCTDTVSNDVIVNPGPTVSFTANDTCLGSETSFVNNSSPQDNSIVDWSWDFGDATTANGLTAAHTYPDPGTYTASLTATSDSGCVASATTDIVIHPNPEPAFSLQDPEGCTPHEVNFLNQSTISSGFLNDYVWSFGTGDSSLQSNPVYTYADSGFYDVSVTVTSAVGCSSFLNVTNAVRANITPEAAFSIGERELTLLDAEIEISQQSQNTLEYFWNFGDGTTSELELPTHQFIEPGNFQVILTVTNGDCEDVTSQQVRVEPLFTFYAPSAFSPNADGINETFFGTGEAIQTYNMKISNRWGEMIFESNDLEFHWDGTHKGKPVEAGTYIYDFFILDNYERDHQYIGKVVLIR